MADVSAFTVPGARALRLGREVWLWVAGVWVTGLGITLLVTLWVAQDAATRDRERFGRLAAAEWDAVETRIESDEQVLKGLAGYFDEITSVNTNQWRHRLELINPQVNHSELVEIGFAVNQAVIWQPVPPEEIMAGKLSAPLPNTAPTAWVLMPVLYSWRPEPWPSRAYGEGFLTDPLLKEAFKHSYMTTQPGMTPPYPLWRDAEGKTVRGVTLVQATFQPEMLTSRVRWPGPTSRRRNDVVAGLVFFSWRMDDLFRAVFGEEPREIALEIFDGTEPVAERRWNTFPPKWLKGTGKRGTRSAEVDWNPAFTANLLRSNYGGKVLVRAYSTPWFDRQSQRGRAGWVAGAGSLLSVALAGLVFVQARGRARAEALGAELAESRELLRRASAERERLSRDLHDGTVQSLYAVGLGLGSLRRGMGDSENGQRIDHALAELDEVVADLRRYLVQLDPGVSPVQRPELAVGQLVERLRRVSAIELTFTVVPDFRVQLAPAIVLDLLQVVRESVSNALRHGHAQRVELSLRQNNDLVRLEVRDDGTGFDPALQVAPREVRHGLDNLRQRAKSHHGRLEVISKPGGPTVVAFEIPLHDRV